MEPKLQINKSRTIFRDAMIYKSEFVVPETKEFIEIFLSQFKLDDDLKGENKVTRRTIGFFITYLDTSFDIKAVDKSFFAEFYNKHYETGITDKIGLITKKALYSYLFLNRKYHWNDELESIDQVISAVMDSIENFAIIILPLLTGERDVKKTRLIKMVHRKTKNPSVGTIYFDVESKFIQDLLVNYYIDTHTVLPGHYEKQFLEHFGESLNFNLPSNLSEFNISTLTQQDHFYMTKFTEENHRHVELECRYFYRYLLNLQGDKKTIGIADGVSLRYLLSPHFHDYYRKGFRFVYLNPSDPVPLIDKWVITPNGLEEKAASTKPEDIVHLDFSRITDSTIRKAAKLWFWKEETTSFDARRRTITYIFEFFEYRDKLRSMYLHKLVQRRAGNSIDVENMIIAEEIIMYTSEWENRCTKESFASRMNSLKRFLEYMNDQDIYKTELACFDYLKPYNRGMGKRKEILPIEKNDFKKLISLLEENAKNNPLHMLYYIIFCLNVLTPLRISSILDLDMDCIQEISSGIFSVNVRVKTSGGEKKLVQISKEVKRLIEVAVSLTNETRQAAPDQYKHYLFLINTHKYRFKVVPQPSYTNYLRTCCKTLDIKKCTAANLRKTYYTNLIENAIKHNVSLMNLKALTDHASIDTTENYYVKENIRNYLEATTGVEIGNIPVLGQVVQNYDEGTNDDIVNDGCGYCRNPECNVLGTANCLMCKGFVTTPNFINQFKEGVSIINQQIKNNPNPHDKEHLYAIKRLYVAYLEKMYLRKEAGNE